MKTVICLGCIGTRPAQRNKQCTFRTEDEFQKHANIFHSTLKHKNGSKVTLDDMKFIFQGNIVNKQLENPDIWEIFQGYTELEARKRGISEESLASTPLSSAPHSPENKPYQMPSTLNIPMVLEGRPQTPLSDIIPQVEGHFLDIPDTIGAYPQSIGEIVLTQDKMQIDHVTEPTEVIPSEELNQRIQEGQLRALLKNDWEKRYTDPDYEEKLRPEHTDASRKAKSQDWQSMVEHIHEVDPELLGHPANSSNYSKDSDLQKDERPKVWDGQDRGYSYYERATSEGMGEITEAPTGPFSQNTFKKADGIIQELKKDGYS